MKEFKINQFLTLRLKEGQINIYVNEKCFNQCKYLMLNIPNEDTKKLDKIESIDEAADLLGWTNDGQEGVNYEIDQETEFWGHCSNLQAWYEHNYDTRLLHSNLAFPLLRKLAEVGDPLAKKVFKEEIAKHFESGYPTVIRFIFEEGLLYYLNGEECEQLIERSFITIERLPNEKKYDIFYNLLEVVKHTGWKEKHFAAFLEVVYKLPDNDKYRAFYNLLEVVKDTGWKEKHFAVFLEIVYKLLDDDKNRAFSDLLKVAKETGWEEEHFAAFLESIDKLPDKYHIFYDLVDSIESTELLNKYNSYIETQFLVFVEDIDKLTYDGRYYAFSWLFKVTKITGLIKEYFPALLEAFKKLPDDDKYRAFSDLIIMIKNTKFLSEFYTRIETQFLIILEAITKLPEYGFFNFFFKLFNGIKGTKLLKDHFSKIETLFLSIVDSIDKLPNNDKCRPFISFINTFKGTELMEKHYSALLNIRIKLTVFIGKRFPDHLMIFDKLTNSNEKTVDDIVSYNNTQYYYTDLYNNTEEFNNYYEVLKVIHNELNPIKIKIDLHNQKIEDIDYLNTIDCIPDEILTIDLSNNLIKKITGLEKFTNLNTLDLQNNKIKKIENLEGLDELRILNLSRNVDIDTIDCIPSEIFKLDLSNNSIKKITGLKKCKNLRILDLQNNKIKKIENLEGLDELRILNLSGNVNIEEIPDFLNNLKKLKDVKLWNCLFSTRKRIL